MNIFEYQGENTQLIGLCWVLVLNTNKAWLSLPGQRKQLDKKGGDHGGFREAFGQSMED